MRKTLLYAIVAVVLGVSLTIIPLITLTRIEVERYETSREAFADSMNKLENIDGFRAEGYPTDLRIFVFSFAVALVAYAIFKFRVIH